MRFIDVHCHINESDYGDVDALIKNIQTAGVEKIISVGFDLPSSKFCKNLAERYACVYFTAGIHPTELKNYRNGDLTEIEKLAEHKKCVAIGEIGLDYHYPDTDKELQRKVFLAQIDLAQKLNLPVQIHSRDCAEDTLNILKDNSSKFSAGGLLHCFSYSPEIAAEIQKLGFGFSFGGTCTYSGSKKARRTIAALNINRIMTETDSPYLAPKSKQGEFPNTPESIPEVAQAIAEIRGLTLEGVAEAVWNNAHTLFKKLN
ncbi:MAG: TatD family hydrolase [Clostridia bacterium]|nr:TatD family hydrolase [Clostridia bacterium]